MVEISGLEGADQNRYIDENLSEVDWLPKFNDGTLYIVGGAWRSLGRLEMERVRYPLHLLHGYYMHAEQAGNMCRLFSGLGRASLDRIAAAPRDRLETLAPAARILGRLILFSGVNKIEFSAHGLREGILFEHLSASDKKNDPLLASCRLVALATARDKENGLGHGHGDGEKLTDWLTPLFPDESEKNKRLRFAAGLLSDIGWRIQTDERPDHVMAEVMRAPLIGLNHRERVQLALAVRFRYNNRLGSYWLRSISGLIEEDDKLWSQRVGLALRLAHTISGGMMNLLGNYCLSMDAKNINLHLGHDKEFLIGEATIKRISTLALSFDRNHNIIPDG